MSKKYNNPKPKFTRGDKVKVIDGGANCSDVTMELLCHPLGVYNIPDYKDKIFTITDNSFTVKNFIDEDINVCVVSHNKKIIGAVYEYALEKVVSTTDEELILIEMKEAINKLTQTLNNNKATIEECISSFLDVLKIKARQKQSEMDKLISEVKNLFS